MKQIAGWKSGLFIGSLAVVALFFEAREQMLRSTEPWYVTHEPQPIRQVENSPRVQEVRIAEKRQEPEPRYIPPIFAPEPRVDTRIDEARMIEQKLELARLAEEEKKREHERFLTRNINPGFSRGAVPTLAVVAGTSAGRLSPQMTSNLIRRLSTNDVALVSSFFTPEFVSDGNFRSLAGGSNELISSLELSKILDGLVLASEDVTYSTTPSLENVITASLHLEVSIIDFGNHNERRSFSWNSSGPGFRENDALQIAEERVLKQIGRDTNFYLMPFHRAL